MNITVTIVDNNTLTGEIIEAILEDTKEITLIERVKDWNDCYSALDNRCPDILLIDIIQFSKGHEIIGLLRERYPQLKIILFTYCKDKAFIVKAMNMGVSGYVSKESDIHHIVKAIREVYEGNDYFYPPLSKLIKEDMDNIKLMLLESQKVNKLTRRELEVMELISKGYSNLQIATELAISDKTVKNHVSNLLKKMGFNDRTQVAVYFLNHKKFK